MPVDRGKKYLFETRYDLTGFPKVRPSLKYISKVVADFLIDIISDHGLPLRIVVDGGPENVKHIAKALSDLGV